jgi:fatty acid desaturase
MISGNAALAEEITEEPQIEKVSDLLKNINMEGFIAELKVLRKEIDANLGEADIKHLKKMESWGHIANTIGALTSWIAPNPLSAVAMSLGRSTRWLLMHHIGHRGYDNVPGIPKKYTSKHFATGLRRFIDWPDWMTPESWKYEHNVLHHSHTGEMRDPDVLERNAHLIRNSNLPLFVKYSLMWMIGATWKAIYYAPNNLQEMLTRFDDESSKKYDGNIDLKRILPDLLLQSYIPYSILQFVIFPALFLPLGPWSVFSATCNSIAAELLSNLHGFCVVAPNHTAEDIYRFESKPESRAERYFRQIIGTVNYKTGDDLTDYAHFWLNYQIEHHIWPDIPMLKYQQVQPQIKALCEKYNIPYLQEDIFIRIRKMMDVCVGKTSMKSLA